MQRTWLRQGGKRRENLSLDRVKSALGAKTPSPLNKPLGSLSFVTSMKKELPQHLEILKPLSVNSALWVLRSSFGNYFQNVFKIPLQEVDKWVVSINDEKIEQYWSYQRQMKRPRL
ncbi:MAG: hypothetical protein AB8I58_19460, partial [Anaerolineales bacterium]